MDAVAAIADRGAPRAPRSRFWLPGPGEAAADLPVDPVPAAVGHDGSESSAAERKKLRRVLGRLDTIFFLISAMVVVDTIGAIAVGGGETFTWLVMLFVTFFIPSALISAELGAAHPGGGRRLRVGPPGVRPLRRCADLAAVLGRDADVARRLGRRGGDGGLPAVRSAA